ncbi:TlpA family protein disulfide reductase [Aeoliella sp. ICT_H6.2]|uniref:TlpA family protein disulfide reductase n=1 Tax=Aeoliella straminimaris TaxID=2954799 RepID=A0A9X2FH09_9BACT|nr:TlpA disulfide reductase family protein [Aeoliella straminimaris]MCO6048127.1 TlpA family protein disulfide reductase [Aeoliella straminimaris]
MPQLANADRLAQVEALKSQYEEVAEDWRGSFTPLEGRERLSTEQSIQAYNEWPAWSFLPRFLKLATENPDDDAAYECCQWILQCINAVGNSEQRAFSADQIVWHILAMHQTHRDELPLLCLQAAQFPGPGREQFLRKLQNDADSSHKVQGFAITALAEMLSQKYEIASTRQRRRGHGSSNEFNEYVRSRECPNWKLYIEQGKPEEYRQDAIELFREVLSRHQDIPVSITAPSFRNLDTLGEKAAQSLYALEHLIVGTEAPNILGTDLHGKPLDLREYRGKVVVLSFWFPECGPCLALVPEEKRLAETFQDRPFALLGVCRAEQREEALEVADKHSMDWPIWYDGPEGPIVRDYNILSWPTIYVLDPEGRIVEKKLLGKDLEDLVANLLDKKEKQGR